MRRVTESKNLFTAYRYYELAYDMGLEMALIKVKELEPSINKLKEDLKN